MPARFRRLGRPGEGMNRNPEGRRQRVVPLADGRKLTLGINRRASRTPGYMEEAIRK